MLIKGGNRLNGTVQINGAKNAALPIMAATLLANSTHSFENIPDISDVWSMSEILSSLGAEVKRTEDGILRIDTTKVNKYQTHDSYVRKIRASNLLIGPLLARYGRAEVALPGGCAIGSRPMDLHLKGFEALGAKVSVEYGWVKVAADKLKGTNIYLDFPSVGATENIMMAAVLAEGVTVLENVAKEPEIVDLANFLNAMGAKISGAGTDVIKITGVKDMRGVFYSIIPDRIEVGTFMLAAAVTRGTITMENVIPKHVEALIAKLRETGIRVETGEESIKVVGGPRPVAVDIKTLPYPGFPTDMQPQMMVLMALAEGTSIITETIFENRFMHVDELRRMGAKIKTEGNSAIIEGTETLNGANVQATDLRAGAALVLAGLAAEGETCISGIEYIERGYEGIVEKIRALGGNIAIIEGAK